MMTRVGGECVRNSSGTGLALRRCLLNHEIEKSWTRHEIYYYYYYHHHFDNNNNNNNNNNNK